MRIKLILGILAVLAVVLLMGCSAEVENDSEVRVLDEGKLFQEVTVAGDNQDKVIDNPGKQITLSISGVENKISVTKKTSILIMHLSGTRNKITLCEGVHKPQISKTGQDNEIVYVNC